MSADVHSELPERALDVWRRSRLARHLVEMLLAMQVGMALGSLLLAGCLNATVDETAAQHPVAAVLVMALSMTVPMVAWMLHRGHSRRSAAEMAAVMVAPALPVAGLQAIDVVTASACGGYMAVSTLAMIALALYRRDEYRARAEAH